MFITGHAKNLSNSNFSQKSISFPFGSCLFKASETVIYFVVHTVLHGRLPSKTLFLSFNSEVYLQKTAKNETYRQLEFESLRIPFLELFAAKICSFFPFLSDSCACPTSKKSKTISNNWSYLACQKRKKIGFTFYHFLN